MSPTRHESGRLSMDLVDTALIPLPAPSRLLNFSVADRAGRI
jgi:hypothetical protein